MPPQGVLRALFSSPYRQAEISAERGDQSAVLRREAHRRWQNYFKMAPNRLEAPRTGGAGRTYKMAIVHGELHMTMMDFTRFYPEIWGVVPTFDK